MSTSVAAAMQPFTAYVVLRLRLRRPAARTFNLRKRKKNSRSGTGVTISLAVILQEAASVKEHLLQWSIGWPRLILS